MGLDYPRCPDQRDLSIMMRFAMVPWIFIESGLQLSRCALTPSATRPLYHDLDRPSSEYQPEVRRKCTTRYYSCHPALQKSALIGSTCAWPIHLTCTVSTHSVPSHVPSAAGWTTRTAPFFVQTQAPVLHCFRGHRLNLILPVIH